MTDSEQSGRPKVACHDVRDQSHWWPRSGPLPVAVREQLASGFGVRLRELRRERGLSQEGLAGLLLCDRRTIGRLELGRHRPTRQQVAWLARALSDEVGDPPQRLDHELLNLVGGHVRHRRRGERSGLYTLPGEHAKEITALEQKAAQVLRRLRS